jgi:hypothetical protein
MVIEARVSPVSTSLKPKSAVLKVWALSSFRVTVLSAAVGASFTAATVSVAVLVALLNAVVPPLVLVSAVPPFVPVVVSQARKIMLPALPL